MAEALTGLEALGPVSPFPGPASEEAALEEVGRRVLAARKRRPLTGQALGDLVGLGKDQISKIESGRRRVNARELPKFAQALGVTIGYLMGQSSKPRLAMAHRLACEATAEGAHGTSRRALQLLEIEDVLVQRVVVPPSVSSPAGDRVRDFAGTSLAGRPREWREAQRQGRQLAECVRTELDLGTHEIGDLAGLIERAFGVDVAVSPLGTQADGLCAHGEDVALIVASSGFSEGHVRFTLAHELGHHLLSDPRDLIEESHGDMFASDDLQEKRVNAFAGHLLMPEQGIKETLAWLSEGRVTERSLVALMDQFGVSRDALVYQLGLLKLITFEQSSQLRDCRVRELVARNRDVAPRGAGTTPQHTVRAPERLLGTAVRAARDEKIGLGVVAALLEREDDEALWEEIMEAPTSEVLA